MKNLKITKCLHCPFRLPGNTTKSGYVGYCKRVKGYKNLAGTMIEDEKGKYEQIIPSWCPLDDAPVKPGRSLEETDPDLWNKAYGIEEE